MVRISSLLIGLLFLSGCTLQLVAPYDEEIFNGVTEYKQLLSKHVKDMAVLSGTNQGTFSSNQLKYNALEVKLELMIDRASLQSTAAGCSLSPKLSQTVDRYLRDQVPPALASATKQEDDNSYGCTHRLLVLVQQQLIQLEAIHRDIDKCEFRETQDESIATTFSSQSIADSEVSDAIDTAIDQVLSSLKASVREAVLSKVETLYQPRDSSDIAAAQEISCLRPATAQSVLDISNQSINAVWVLENAKKISQE